MLPLTRRVHKAAHHKARGRTTGQMQSRPFLHVQMSGQSALGKEICGKLDSAAETGTDHSGTHSAVHAFDTFALVDFAQSVKRVFIVVLGADREEGRVGLQARLDQEEWRTSCGPNDAGGSTSKYIGSKRLNLWVAIDGRCDAGADGLVETETAAVEQDLIDILNIPRVSSVCTSRQFLGKDRNVTYGRPDSPEQTSGAFVL